MKKILSIIFLSIILASCGQVERQIIIAPLPEGFDSQEVREVQNLLKCGDNYSDACQSVFGYCGASDFPNKEYKSYTQCVSQEYKIFNSH